MKFALSLTSVVSALALLPSAHAWGKDGHAIVATIAELHLDPSVLPTLCSILDLGSGKSCSIASVASWADEVRNKMRWSEPLHFVNAVADHPPQLCPFPGPKGWEGRQNANVLSAIRNVTDSLTRWVAGGSDQSDPIASEALKFLIHFVGDLHQPLHLAGRARGGNDIYVKWSNRKSRFHALWDGNVVERAIETTASEWERALDPSIERHLHGSAYDPLVRRVLVDGINQAWSGETGSWIKCPATTSGGGSTDQTVFQSQWGPSDTDDGTVCPWAWAQPVNHLNCDWVWPKELDEPPYDEPQGPLLELDTDEYSGRITQGWVVEKLLAQAGLRLAAILNSIFVSS